MSDASQNDKPVVVVSDVCKEFRREQMVVPVLSGINLNLWAGDYLALMGPSGSGKTTLLNLIAGLDRPTSGKVIVCDQDLGASSEGELAKWRSRHIGFIFQLYNLIPVLTAYENVELPLTLTSLSRRERDDHVKAALEVVGAYRLAAGDEVYGNQGMNGFYTSTLFRFSEEFEKYLPQSLELGRSFVQPDYWNSQALDYLWHGIGAFLAARPQYSYLFGPVSVSASYTPEARELLVFFYRKWFGRKDAPVRAKHRFAFHKGTEEKLATVFKGEDYKQSFKELKQNLKHYGYAVPTLYKQYTELCDEGGVSFFDFGIDKDFNNSLDGFIFLEIGKIKEAKLERYIYSKRLKEEWSAARTEAATTHRAAGRDVAAQREVGQRARRTRAAHRRFQRERGGADGQRAAVDVVRRSRQIESPAARDLAGRTCRAEILEGQGQRGRIRRRAEAAADGREHCRHRAVGRDAVDHAVHRHHARAVADIGVVVAVEVFDREIEPAAAVAGFAVGLGDTGDEFRPHRQPVRQAVDGGQQHVEQHALASHLRADQQAGRIRQVQGRRHRFLRRRGVVGAGQRQRPPTAGRPRVGTATPAATTTAKRQNECHEGRGPVPDAAACVHRVLPGSSVPQCSPCRQ